MYACRVERELAPGESAALGPGVLNLGLRPTVQGGFSVEAHILDFSGDLYDARLRLSLVAKLRDEQRFSDIQALKAQIARDVEVARALLAGSA